ncbi:MAG: DUF4079 family protein [Deltaproteobacteria bacterium]|nr:MAG: DUF4079 family protein [Deltaproteobacteria bacterium]TDJ16415.1 MAG: DUF4079 family protein [Deltaproteobacteria bacterium]
MVVSLALAGLALRSGLALRRSRLGRTVRKPDARRAHLRFAKPAVVLLSLGFFGGLGSALWLRGWDVFGTFHGILGLFVIAFFGAAAVLGHRIETGRSQHFDAHARLAGVAILLSAIAAVAGFVLLP